jgi:hypothetical protein
MGSPTVPEGRDPVGPRAEQEKPLMRMLRLPFVETQGSKVSGLLSNLGFIDRIGADL